MFKLRKFSHVLCAIVIAQLAGCASFEFTKPLPEQKQPVSVSVSKEGLSGWSDMPLGVYNVPDSQVVISGHQSGQGAALLFGLVGVAVVHAANASAGAQTVKDAEQQLKIDLTAPVAAAVHDAIAAGRLPAQFTEKPGSPKRLVLAPGLVLSFVNDKDVRPFVVIRADLLGNDRVPEWKGRFIASSGESRPLLGPGGWLEADAKALKESTKRNLDLAMNVMTSDIRNPAKRDETKMYAVESNFPFVKQRFQTKGYVLAEDDNYYTYIPKIGDVIVFTGVNVLDKHAVTVRPAKPEDPVIKIVPLAEPAKN